MGAKATECPQDTRSDLQLVARRDQFVSVGGLTIMGEGHRNRAAFNKGVDDFGVDFVPAGFTDGVQQLKPNPTRAWLVRCLAPIPLKRVGQQVMLLDEIGGAQN